MHLIILMVLASLVLATLFVLIFIWATRQGQFDDLESPAHRMLFDDIEQKNKKYP